MPGTKAVARLGSGDGSKASLAEGTGLQLWQLLPTLLCGPLVCTSHVTLDATLEVGGAVVVPVLQMRWGNLPEVTHPRSSRRSNTRTCGLNWALSFRQGPASFKVAVGCHMLT